MTLAITTGMSITVDNVKYVVIEVETNNTRPNTRAAMDKAGIQDMLIVKRGKNAYSINRYSNGELGKAVKY